MVKRRKPRGCGFTAAINDETDRAHLDMYGASPAARQDRLTAREDAGTAISGIDLQQGTPEGSPVKRKTPCIHPASSRSSE